MPLECVVAFSLPFAMESTKHDHNAESTKKDFELRCVSASIGDGRRPRRDLVHKRERYL